MGPEDGDFVEIPDEMFDGDAEEAVLAPLFIGQRIEAELIRSLLEANDIPAVIFGEGTYAFGADNISPTERVMVRSDHFEQALRVIRETDIDAGRIVEEIDDSDPEPLVAYEIDGSELESDAGSAISVAEEHDPDGVPVLAGGSDWGPRVAGLIGLAALATVIIVILQKG